MEPDQLLAELMNDRWVRCSDLAAELPDALLPEGAGVVMSSGGSSGGRKVCLLPTGHLHDSAAATAQWLEDIGIDPSAAVQVNPLPRRHISGLMPWWRSRCWGSPYVELTPEAIKHPLALLEQGEWPHQASCLSLVPTQLGRLLADPAGAEWLQRFSVIWVGGSALRPDHADAARRHELRLAPCYGSTETTAMVAALTPEQFLSGVQGCGQPLADVELRLSGQQVLEIRTRRLAVAAWSSFTPERLQPLADAEGWWRSGDRALLGDSLQILGRIDTAIHTGGVTVFPEQLEPRLMQAAQAAGLPLDAVLMLGLEDPEWGESLVALVRCSDPAMVGSLAQLTCSWPAPERPKLWLFCADLAPDSTGKWKRQEWLLWLRSKI